MSISKIYFSIKRYGGATQLMSHVNNNKKRNAPLSLLVPQQRLTKGSPGVGHLGTVMQQGRTNANDLHDNSGHLGAQSHTACVYQDCSVPACGLAEVSNAAPVHSVMAHRPRLDPQRKQLAFGSVAEFLVPRKRTSTDMLWERATERHGGATSWD